MAHHHTSPCRAYHQPKGGVDGHLKHPKGRQEPMNPAGPGVPPECLWEASRSPAGPGRWATSNETRSAVQLLEDYLTLALD